MFILYLLSVVVIFYFHRPGDIESPGPIEYARWSRSSVGSFPCGSSSTLSLLVPRLTLTLSFYSVQVLAYTCAQNIFPVFSKLQSNTQKRMNLVIGSSIGSAVVIYEVLALACVHDPSLDARCSPADWCSAPPAGT